MRFRFLMLIMLPVIIAACGGGSDESFPDISRTRFAMGGVRTAQVDSANTISVAGYRDNYMIGTSNGTVTLTNKLDASDVKTYSSATLIKFIDKWTSFDIDGAPGQVYRLYQAAFNRNPDLPGLGFWIAANQNGRDMLGIASDFIVSNEFKTMYGDNPTNLMLIGLFYNNVLHRDGEKAGVDWWVAQMDAGAARPGVLYGFSDSAENKANLEAEMMNGFDYVPYIYVSEVKTFSTCQNDLGLTSVEGSFMMVNNIWNPGTAKYTQCASATIAKETGVQSALFEWDFVSSDNSVKTFPSIAYGQKSGYTSTTTDKMPILIDDMSDIFVYGNVITKCANLCLYDTALDLFFSKTKTTSGFNPSSEIMILTDYNVKTFGGNYQGRVTIDGAQYDLYQGTIPNGSDPTQTWNFISYVAVINTTVLRLNMAGFIRDSVRRGFIRSTEYLDSIEVGTEVIYGKGQTTMSNYQIVQ